MVDGLHGVSGYRVLHLVAVETNHETARVQTLHQPMVGRTVQELAQRQRHVEQLLVHHVSKNKYLFITLFNYFWKKEYIVSKQ
jgi:hypothetical protein